MSANVAPTTTLATPGTASPEMLRLLAAWERADPAPHQARMQAASDRRALAGDAMRTYLTSKGHGHGAVAQITGYVRQGERSVVPQRVSQIIAKAGEVRDDVARLSAALVGGALSAADHEAEAHHFAAALALPYPPDPSDLPGWARTDVHRDWVAPSGTTYSVYDHDPGRPGKVADHVEVVAVHLPPVQDGSPERFYDVCYYSSASA